jgi:hypothetical protein
MHNTTFSKRFLTLLAVTLTATACGIFLFSGNVTAKGKPGGSGGGGNGGGGGGDLTITGTIYFEDPNGDPFILDSAGVSAQNVAAWGHPSFNTHNGESWTVQNDYTLAAWPDSDFFRRNLFLVNEDGLTTVNFLIDPDLDVASVEWTAGDSCLGFVGRWIDSNDTVTEFGLYLAEVAYDQTTDEPTGIVGDPIQILDYLAFGQMNDEIPAISPDLSEVAVSDWYSRHSLRVYSVETGAFLREIAVDDVAGKEHWSPDGTAIVYRGLEGITVVDPQGNGRIVIAREEGNRKSTYTNTLYPLWSQDSKQIVYQYWEDNPRKPLKTELHIVNRDGTQETDLTKGQLNFSPIPRGWRE